MKIKINQKKQFLLTNNDNKAGLFLTLFLQFATASNRTWYPIFALKKIQILVKNCCKNYNNYNFINKIMADLKNKYDEVAIWSRR